MAKIHGNDPTGYSYGDADGLRSAADGLASLLSGQAGSRSSLATTASAEFRGYFSDVFSANVDVASRSASELVDALQSLSGFVDELREAAEQEDARREKAKAWDARQRERDENPLVAVRDEVGSWFGADDDPKPPEPEPEPRLSADAVTVAGRTIPGGGGSGGSTSSAVPADLRSFQTGIRGADAELEGAVTTFRNALTDYESSCNPCWGTLSAQSLATAVQDWLSANGDDADWAGAVATQFEAAGGEAEVVSLSDASISAALAAAGVSVTREDFTIGPFSAMGTPPTNGFADDPVNTSSGNFLEPEIDLPFTGAASALRHTRMYNSLDTRVGVFGPGWSSVLDIRLEWGDDGAEVVLDDGRVVQFARSGDGYDRASGENLRLGRESFDDAPTVGVPAVGGPSALVMRDLRGGWWAFTPSGAWLGQGRGPGTGVSVHRDAQGRISRLEHERGRFVDVAYEHDHVVSASASDGRRVEYRYDGDRLVAVEDAVGVRRYHWNEAGLIDRVTSSSGVVECENDYDRRGRVIEQRTPFGRRVRFAYLQGGVTSVSDVDGGDTNTWISDRRGRVVGIVDSEGRRQSMAYDAQGELVSSTGRDGQVTVHAYDDRGRRVRTVTPAGADHAYGYDDHDRLTTVATTKGVVEYRYATDDDRAPSVVVDAGGGRTLLEWSDGLLTSATDPEGVQVRFVYDASGDIVAVVDAEGGSSRLVRDACGRVIEAVTPSGARTRYRYDAAGLLVAREDAAGGVWRLEHGVGGRVTATIDPLGARTVIDHGPHGEIERVTDPLGRVVSKDFDESGNLTAVTLPDGASWDFVHDALSRLREVVDPDGGVWEREYDAIGRLSATVDPTGVRVDLSRAPEGTSTTVSDAFEQASVDTDEQGRPTRVERTGGSAEIVTYDACGRAVELLDADGGLTRIRRDLAGRVVAVTAPGGGTTRYEYDTCGRPVGATDPLGARTTLTYDVDSRVIARTLPTGEVAETEYDVLGRVVRTSTPGVGDARYGYDGVGRVVSIADTRFGRRTFRYDAAGQLIAAVNGLGGITRYDFDVRGRVTRVTDPLGGVTLRSYTGLDKVSSTTDPLGRTTTAEYDAAGRQRTQTDPDGGTLEWVFDASGSEVEQRADGRLLVRIDRDPASRTTTCTDVTDPSAPATHTLTRDRRGRVTVRETRSVDRTRTTRWEYDADGRRSALHAPDGSTLRYERDGSGRVSRVEHTVFGEARYEYDAAGRLTALRASDAFETWEYVDGYPVVHTSADADGVRVTRVARDEGGRIRGIETPEASTAFEYDAADQMTSVTRSAGAGGTRTSTEYDVAGRLLVETVDGVRREHRHDAAGQLVSLEADGASRILFEYDGHGRRRRVVGDDGRTTDYEWDPRGWLSSVTESDDGRERITHLHVDALGELVRVGGDLIDWDSAASVPTPVVMGGVPVGHGPGGVVGVGAGAGWTSSGWRTARSTSDEDPWSILASVTGAVLPDATGLGTSGELVVAGLEWLGARAYDPRTKGFLSADPQPAPTGAAWAANPYAYAGNDPVHALDPLGLSPVTDAELAGYAESLQGPLARAAGAAGHWLQDNWEYVAGGAMVVAGGVLVATGVGGPVGMMLIGAGADTIIQKATTGEVNWGQVAVSGAFGAVGGGVATTIGRHIVGNAAEGAVESVATYAVSGQPVTVSGLVRNAGEGAATSAATGGTMNRLPVSTAKLDDIAPVPPAPTSLYRGVNETHHVYPEAQSGSAWPGDIMGHTDGRAHALGMTEDSNLTSWSTDRSVAERFASDPSGQGVLDPNGRGVILSTTLEEQSHRVVPGPDQLGESEVLLRGVVNDAHVERYGQ